MLSTHLKIILTQNIYRFCLNELVKFKDTFNLFCKIRFNNIIILIKTYYGVQK